jgi:hypothetical protein
LVPGVNPPPAPAATAQLPPLAADSEMHSATVLREEYPAALEAADCPSAVNPRLPFGKHSSSITQPGGVCADCAVFTLPVRDDEIPHWDRHYLTVLHKHTA